MLYSTLVTLNGKGTMYLPKGHMCAGVKWLKDRIRPHISGHEPDFYQEKLLIIDQPLWNSIVEKYAKDNCLEDLNLSNCYFFDIKFEGLHLEDVDFTNSYFSGCIFNGLSFTNCLFQKATIYDEMNCCIFSNCNFSQSGLFHIVFRNCKIEKCDFSCSVMRHVTYYMCSIFENEYLGVTMDTVYFRGSCCLNNKSISNISITMGGARYDEVAAHKESIINAFTTKEAS